MSTASCSYSERPPVAEMEASTSAQAKLPRLAPGAKLRKRALTRRQPPASATRPLIYVSSRSSFMSIVRRAEALLAKSLRNTTAAPRNATLSSRVAALERGSSAGGTTVVKLVATGKAVDRAIRVAGWFEQRGDCVVEVRTGTTGTVDDVVLDDEDDDDDDCFGEDESRSRKLSVLEVCVSLK